MKDRMEAAWTSDCPVWDETHKRHSTLPVLPSRHSETKSRIYTGETVQAMIALQSAMDELQYMADDSFVSKLHSFRDECELFSKTRIEAKMLEQHVDGTDQRSK